MKRRQELQANEEVLNKRKKKMINEKKWLIQSYIGDLVVECTCFDFTSLFFLFIIDHFDNILVFLVWVSTNLSLQLWKWFNRKTLVIQSQERNLCQVFKSLSCFCSPFLKSFPFILLFLKIFASVLLLIWNLLYFSLDWHCFYSH